ncbi:MAG: hypothetical protein ACFFG0_02085 [Candidatus Thorarchaeota archaeon]
MNWKPTFDEKEVEDEISLSQRMRNVKDYFLIEFVAVPQEFDIGSYLTLREHIGQFNDAPVDLTTIKKIMDGIRYSPVCSLLHNALLPPETGLYVLSILDELNLVIRSIPNPLRSAWSRSDYKNMIGRITESKQRRYRIHIGGQDAEKVNLVIVNLFPMLQKHVLDEAAKISKSLEKYQKEVDDNIKKIGKLD